MALFNKKPKADNLEELRDITDDVIEGEFVPYASHWDPHTIITKNGEVLQTIKIVGLTHDQANDDDDGDLRSQIREAILTCVDSTQYAVWIHTVRRKTNWQTKGEYKRDFAGYLNRFWNDRNDWEHQFTNEIYVTVVREGQSAGIFDPASFIRGVIPRFDLRHRERFIDEAAAALSAVMEKMLPLLKGYGAARLGIVKRGGVWYSEIAGFLGKLVTLLDDDFPLEDVDLSHALTDYDVTFGFNAMEVRMRRDGKRRFGAILTLKEYIELGVGPLERILQIPAEFIISQCFEFTKAKRALKDYEYQKELFDISKSQALLEKTGLEGILTSNQDRSTDYGMHQINVFLLADSIKALDAAVSKAVSGLSSLGQTPMREDIKLEECYWAILPANFEFIKRLRPINTARIAGLANVNNFPSGAREGNLWGPAVTTFYTAARTPYFFNFHEGKNGHTTIIGPENAGKTVLMNFLLAQACKYDNRIFFFDMHRSSEIFLRSIGGAYYNLWPESETRPFARTSLNPFHLDDTIANREFLRNWMASLAGAEIPGLFTVCERVIGQVMLQPKHERHLGLAVQMMRAGNMEFLDLFLPWAGSGELAGIFDHVEDSLSLQEKVYGFEMADVVKHPRALAPVMLYLMHRIGQSLDGSPTIIAMTEAWTFLDNPFFTTGLREWLAMLTAKNALGIFATEHIEEVSGSGMNALLLKNAGTQIYLPDESANPDYKQAFGLNDKDISYLTVMNTEDRHFLIKRGANSFVLELNLAGMMDILTVLSSTPQSLQVMERAMKEQGPQASRWMPTFLGKK